MVSFILSVEHSCALPSQYQSRMLNLACVDTQNHDA
jgi:hypothetical protein